MNVAGSLQLAGMHSLVWRYKTIEISDLDINEMRKYCVVKSDGTKETGDTHQNDIDAIQQRLDHEHVQYYLTKENDTWAKVCNAMDVEHAPSVMEKLLHNTGALLHNTGAGVSM